MTITVRHLGGGEAWLEIKARGRTILRPGHLALFDLMTELWGQTPSR